jgi:hypothetical protein
MASVQELLSPPGHISRDQILTNPPNRLPTLVFTSRHYGQARSWIRRQSVSHQVDTDIGVARISPGRGVLGAAHVAEQDIFAGVGAIDSERPREGLKDVLLGPAQLYEALREKAGQRAELE